MKQILSDTLQAGGKSLTGVAAIDGVDMIAGGTDTLSLVLKAVIVIITAGKPLVGAVKSLIGLFRKKSVIE